MSYKVDQCPYCDLTYPHQGPTGCPPFIRGIGHGQVAWDRYAQSLRDLGNSEERVAELIAERGTPERDEDFALFLDHVHQAQVQGLTLGQWMQQQVDKRIAETHTCTVYCPPECEFKQSNPEWLTAAQVNALWDEYAGLHDEFDRIGARMKEILDRIHQSGESKLRSMRESGMESWDPQFIGGMTEDEDRIRSQSDE